MLSIGMNEGVTLLFKEVEYDDVALGNEDKPREQVRKQVGR